MKQPSDIPLRGATLHGAVDLGARRAAAERVARQQTQQGAAPGAPSAGNSLIIDVTDATFNTEVVERSRTVPVIMDLWAEWCGPCKQLGPVLEKLATEAAGRWILAKVDVDSNPQLAQALRVQSIPMVVAVAGGQMVDGFLGALPESQVRQWIDQLLEAVSQAGLTSGGMLPDGGGADGAEMGPDPLETEAREALQRGDFDTAAKAFTTLAERSPGDPLAKIGLAQVELLRRVRSYDPAATRRAAAERPGDAQAQCQVADLEVYEGRIEEAFDRLLGAVRRMSGADRDQVRTHLVSLFDVLPASDPAVKKARSGLTAALF